MVMRRGRALLQLLEPIGVIPVTQTGRESGANGALLSELATIPGVWKELDGKSKVI